MSHSDDAKMQRRNEVDISANLDVARKKMDRKDDGYRSFDYCFNYFQKSRDREELSRLTDDGRLEVSCMQLGFYLASFGMMRGSTQLSKRSARALVPAVEAIADFPPELWSTDLDCCVGSLEYVMDAYDRIHRTIKFASSVLITKIMMGVLGCAPALDQYFCTGFDCPTDPPRSTVEKAFRAVGEYYKLNRNRIDAENIFTLEFTTGMPTRPTRRYPPAKIIDMIFFEEGATRLRRS